MTIRELIDPTWIVVNDEKVRSGLGLDKTVAIAVSPDQLPVIQLFATQAAADDAAKDAAGFRSAPLDTNDAVWAVLEMTRQTGVKHVQFFPSSGTPEKTQRIADFIDGFSPSIP